MIVAATGHRPDKLGGYSNHVLERLTDLAVAALERKQATMVISGMALGWDTAMARAAIRLGLTFYAYVPFVGQESLWPKPSQQMYHELLERAHVVFTVTEGEYSPEAMQLRNQRMVQDCQLLMALWNGSKGGTANCIRYAKSIDRAILNLWPSWERYAALSV